MTDASAVADPVTSAETVDAAAQPATPSERPSESSSASDPPLHDFRKGSRVGGTRMRALHAMHEIFSDSLSAWLTAKLRTDVRIRLETLEERSFDEIVRGLDKPCAAYLYEAPGRPELAAMVHVGPEFGFTVVDRLLGGSLEPLVPERAFTHLESRVVGLVVERVREGVEEMWADHVPFTLRADGFETFPDMLRFAQPEEVFLVSRMAVKSENWESHVTIHLPFELLEAGLASGSVSVDSESMPADVERRLLEGHVLEAQVTVDARLPAFPVSLGQLGTLRPGVILATRIPANAPVEVSVCGQKRFLGAAGRLGPDLAVRITTPMSGQPDS